MNTSHHFEPKTFSKFTHCNYCSRFIWGVAHQGLQCTVCHYCCHYDCESEVSKQCLADGGGGNSQDTLSSKKSAAERALLHIQKRLPKKGEPNTSRSSPLGHQTQSDRDKNNASTTVGDSISFVEAFKNTVVGAALEASEKATSNAPVSEYLVNIPPLHPHTMTRNFSRFVSRCGVIFSVRDSIILLVSWDNPLNTWIAIVVYSLICLHPELLLVIPYPVLLYLILTRQTKTGEKGQQQPRQSTSGDEPVPVKSTSSPAINPNQPLSSTVSSASGTEKKADPATQPKNSEGGFTSTFNIGLSLLSSSGSDSPEYRKNIQNIQQMMGEFSDGYDMCMNMWSQWLSNEDVETLLIQLLIGASIGASVIIYFVPLNYLCLVAGIAVFFTNTRFSKALITLAMKDPGNNAIRKKVVSMLQQEKTIWLNRQRGEAIQDDEAYRIVSIFENQRYHQEKGYTAELAPKDGRSAYSNLTGSVSFSAPALVSPPKGYNWMPDSDWRLDETGPWQESYLGVEVMAHPDKDGWVYTDDRWRNAEKVLGEDKDSAELTTRRRRWIRKCVPGKDGKILSSMGLLVTSNTDPFL